MIWPLRFEFDIEYCLPPSLWKFRKYTSHDLQMISRMVFQCYPIEEVNAARVALGLKPLIEMIPSLPTELKVIAKPTITNHDDVKAY